MCYNVDTLFNNAKSDKANDFCKEAREGAFSPRPNARASRAELQGAKRLDLQEKCSAAPVGGPGDPTRTRRAPRFSLQRPWS